MQKILMISRLFEPHLGGVERHVEEVGWRLGKLGYRVHVLTEQYDEALPLESYHRGMRIIRLPYSALDSKMGVWKWMLDHKALFKKYDLVHVHDVFWWYFPVRMVMRDVPVYVTFHGYEPGGLPKTRRKVLRKFSEKAADGSMYVGAFMRKWYWADPDAVTYGASDVVPGRNSTTRSAVFIGRLEADTGIFAYLRALMDIKPAINLDIYGEGPDEKEVAKIIKRNRLAASLHGWTDKPVAKMKRAEYVFTSQYLTMLDAMRSKKLVVAIYDNPMKKDYLYMHPESKHMIIANSGKDLADKFSSLSSVYEKEYVDSAFEWAEKQTWDRLVNQYRNLWHV